MDNIRQKLNQLLELTNAVSTLDNLAEEMENKNCDVQKHLLDAQNVLWQRSNGLILELSELISQKANLIQSLVADKQQDNETTSTDSDERKVIITPLPRVEGDKNEPCAEPLLPPEQHHALRVVSEQTTDVVRFDKPQVPATSQVPEPQPIIPTKQPQSEAVQAIVSQTPVTEPHTANEIKPTEAESSPLQEQQYGQERKSWFSSVANKLGVSQKAETETEPEQAQSMVPPKPLRAYDLKKNLGIADRFRFQRELFGGNGEKLAEAITYINEMTSMQDVMHHISMELRWNREDPVVKDFIAFVQKKFD